MVHHTVIGRCLAHTSRSSLRRSVLRGVSPQQEKGEEDGQDDRFFATMSNAEGQSYVPVFTNLTSFAKWYGNETFGLPFRKAKGTILQWPLSEIYQPSTGENELDKVQGIVINPFDEQPELVDWSYFEGDSE